MRCSKSVSDHEVFERNGCRARFHLFRNEAKGFADRSSEKIHIGSITILDFFIPLELEQREREKAEHCVCVKRRVSRARFLIETESFVREVCNG
ncbi:hypothetical protein TNCT_702741 [Trichonephila clavata]|uniref:Uncharacterized protein n=1 Tax=Trichonephila clavata TaxID=2740835 RepID=A0A8X6M3W9_TRICU|nr:hypothetical protein TNCT_702741 [Trichonephila clavata]